MTNPYKQGVLTKMLHERVGGVAVRLAEEEKGSFLEFDICGTLSQDSLQADDCVTLLTKSNEALSRHMDMLTSALEAEDTDRAKYISYRMSDLSYLSGVFGSMAVVRETAGLFNSAIVLASLRTGKLPPEVVQWRGMYLFLASVLGATTMSLLIRLFGG